eukprot:CAMPEP_0117505276 /NCGR_PEP_ID=MMETSP0784-20121206/25293_1 /TAXON_ID=39447 /ORGANISM="" /LENGTH=491 /DNA_ID=CAMNT_0005300681 /DNA_START=19 /DNA_END=1494 /DNA_ORIENTATION=+
MALSSNASERDCACIWDRICGVSTDALLAYQTPKVVKIYDRTLGMVKCSLMFAIFGHIFVYNICYKGAHLEKSGVSGVARLQWQEPTLDNCNPSDRDCVASFGGVKQLPYCSQYTGGDVNVVNRECDYFDARDLAMTVSGGVLLPTFFNHFKQKRVCNAGSVTCRQKYQYLDSHGKVQEGIGRAEPIRSSFVTNAEHFTLLIDHGFRTVDGQIAHNDFEMRGEWTMCDKSRENCVTRPIKCMHEACVEPWSQNGKPRSLLASILRGREKSRASIQSSKTNLRSSRSFVPSSFMEGVGDSAGAVDTVSGSFLGEGIKASLVDPTAGHEVIAIGGGDVISLRTLLAMAGSSLDENLPDNESMTTRLRGKALVVNIHYDNAAPWTLLHPREPPSYTISVTTRPMEKFKHFVASEIPGDIRNLMVAYGVFVAVDQTGNIVSFSFVHALVFMSAAMALFAASNFLTDMLALYILPKKAFYTDVKFQEARTSSVGEK